MFLSWQLPRGWLASRIHQLKLAVSYGAVKVALVKKKEKQTNANPSHL
jgi:hypothetical protein